MHPELAAPSKLSKPNDTLKLRKAHGKADQASEVPLANEGRAAGKPRPGYESLRRRRQRDFME